MTPPSTLESTQRKQADTPCSTERTVKKATVENKLKVAVEKRHKRSSAKEKKAQKALEKEKKASGQNKKKTLEKRFEKQKKALEKKGSNITATPLNMASENNHVKTVNALLARKDQIKQAKKDGANNAGKYYVCVLYMLILVPQDWHFY